MALFDVSDMDLIAAEYLRYSQNLAALNVLFPPGYPTGLSPEAKELYERGIRARTDAELVSSNFGFSQEVDGTAFEALQNWNEEAAVYIRDLQAFMAVTVEQQAAMASIASQAPTALVDLGDEAWEGFTTSLGETAQGYGEALADVGSGIKSTLSLGKYLPLFVLAAVAFYAVIIYKRG